MRAILIDPQNKTVTPITYDGNWKSIVPLIKAESGLFDLVRVNSNTDCYVDDEGLFVADQHYFAWHDLESFREPIVLAGCALLLDHDAAGESVDVSVTPDWVRERVKFQGEVGSI